MGITVTGRTLDRYDSMQGLDTSLANHFELLIMTLGKNCGSGFKRKQMEATDVKQITCANAGGHYQPFSAGCLSSAALVFVLKVTGGQGTANFEAQWPIFSPVLRTVALFNAAVCDECVLEKRHFFNTKEKMNL